MARPLKPLVRGGGYYPSNKWTPLVYTGGRTTMNGSGEDTPIDPLNTFSGAIASFKCSEARPLVDLTVAIEPVQLGSGDPSPDNIRPISGWTGANIHVSPTTDAADGTTSTIAFPTEAGTVYGGTLNTVNKKLTVTYWGHVFDGSETVSAIGSSSPQNFFIRYGAPANLSNEERICSHFQNVSITTANTVQGYTAVNATNRVQFRYTSLFTTADEFKTWCATQYQNGTPLVAIAKLQTPIEHNITGISGISTIYGTNNIWADTGDVTVQAYAIAL